MGEPAAGARRGDLSGRRPGVAELEVGKLEVGRAEVAAAVATANLTKVPGGMLKAADMAMPSTDATCAASASTTGVDVKIFDACACGFPKSARTPPRPVHCLPATAHEYSP